MFNSYIGRCIIYINVVNIPFFTIDFQKQGLPFDEADITLFEAFAIFCGIGIHNTKMYEGACKLMAKQKVALDCLSYHAAANDDDTNTLAKADIPPGQEFKLDRYPPFCLSRYLDI